MDIKMLRKSNITKTLSCVAILAMTFCQSSTSADDNTGGGTNPPSNNGPKASVWLTKADQSVKLQKQSDITFNASPNLFQTIEVNENQKYQTIDGFGYTLTGGSVEVMNSLSDSNLNALLKEMFGNGEGDIRVNYLRLSVGASDLNSTVFSYNDLPAGETDMSLAKFSLEKDQAVINMVKKILAINPNIKIMSAPWSPPVWMKDNGSSIGGSLKPEYYDVYAQYLVKYIQGMKAQGITIDAITPQNEPLHPGNNPSLLMTAEHQRDFIKKSLGPAFKAANITTKIVAYDHNLDNIEYPTTVLSDAEAASYVDGTAFHLYAGDISAMGVLKNRFPQKNVYFTEQWTGSTGTFAGDFIWHVKNVIIGSMRNHSKNALEWNLANDANFKPHTPGGCTQCKGAITVHNPTNIERNVAYYIIGQVSKFVPMNSQRIESNNAGSLSSVAFKTPEGKTVLVVLNESSTNQVFNIKYNGKLAQTTLVAQAAATYIF